MGFEDIIELVVLLLFFVISPLVRQWRQRRQKGQEPPAGDVESPTGQPTGLPAEPEPVATAPPNYASYLSRSLKDIERQARQALRLASQSPLHELPGLAPVAARLVERTRAEVEAIAAIAARATDEEEPVSVRGLRLSRAIEEARSPLGRARATQQLLSELTSQRTDPRYLRTLALLDPLAEGLGAGSSSIGPRRRLVFITDYDPRFIADLLGPGEVGLAPLPRQLTDRAAGWAQLARGVGFDVLGQVEGAVAELRDKAMFGRLDGKKATPPFFASATIDMANAVGAWMHHLAADAVGAHLLGRAYALAVVVTATRRGVSPTQAVTITTESGRYASEPPLLFRLALIDSVLDMEGFTEAENGVGALSQRVELPQEARYVLPNGVTQRLMLPPVLEYMRGLGQIIQTQPLAAAQDQRLADLAASTSKATDRSRVEAAKRAFLDGHTPSGAAVTLLSGAVLAEYEDPERASYLQPLVRALLKPRRRARPAAAAAGRRVSDRLLFRDALVLSEIL